MVGVFLFHKSTVQPPAEWLSKGIKMFFSSQLNLGDLWFHFFSMTSPHTLQGPLDKIWEKRRSKYTHFSDTCDTFLFYVK
jgi:hypothetical protein